MAGEQVRWGILGAGLLADERLAPAMQEARNAELVSIWARSAEKAISFAQRHNVPRFHPTKSTFLADPRLDAVYVCTPNALHCQDVIACAQAGKHVLCEKPMATSLEECRDMADACERAGVTLGVAFMFPFHPLTILARRWIRDGRIGEVKLLRANILFRLPDCERVNPWRFEPSLSGGGALIEVGSHCLDVLDLVYGARPRSLMAITDVERLTPPGEGLATILLDYADEVHGVVTVANCLPGAGPYGNSFEIHGTRGSIVGRGNLVRNPSGMLICRDAKGRETTVTLPDHFDLGLYSAEIQHFSRCILEGRPPRADARYGTQNVQLILAAYESARTGRAVSVSW